jgi:hypothetical protein
LLLTVGCSQNRQSAEIDKIPKTDVSYEILFEGFVTTKPSKEDILPEKTIVFGNEADWLAFSDKYLPVTRSVATMFKSIDFEKYNLIYTATISPKADLYATSSKISGYKIENQNMDPIWDTNFKDGVYAVNDVNEYTLIHPFVILSLVEKSEIPKNLKNLSNNLYISE